MSHKLKHTHKDRKETQMGAHAEAGRGAGAKDLPPLPPLLRLKFFAVHCVVHVVLYLLPRLLLNLLFRWPITAAECLIGVAEPTLTGRTARRIVTACSRRQRAAFEAFGLSDAMTYDGAMYGGHVHTILGTLRPTARAAYTREVVEAPDGNPICLDFLPPRGAARGLVLILPGLTSSSQTGYVRRMAHALSANGFHVAVLNARGVGDTPLVAKRIFCALFTEDLRHVLQTCFTPDLVQKRLRANSPRPLIALCFSLGGIIACKYVGEEGQRGGRRRCPLSAAIAVTTPYDLHEGNRSMHGATQLLLYRRAFYSGLRRYYERHRAIFPHLPGIDAARLFDGANPLVDTIASVHEMDQHIVAPHFGFKSAAEYYSAADCFESLKTGAPVPFMCIAARDDPIAGHPQHIRRWEALMDANPHVVYVEMPTGGHLGFLDGPLAELAQRLNPMERLVLRSINAVCDGVGKSKKGHDAIETTGETGKGG